MFQCQTPAKFRGYNQPTAKAVPVQIKAQISFFQHIFSWVSQVSWYSSIEYKFLYTLTMYDIFNSCKCLWPGECERSHFSFCIPLRFYITNLHLQFLWILCSSLESCYLSKLCLNKSQLHSTIRKYTFQLWQRISKTDNLRAVKCSNYCHLGFRPQSYNKFWKRFQEPFYTHVGESTIGGSLHSSKCKYLTSDSDCRFG